VVTLVAFGICLGVVKLVIGWVGLVGGAKGRWESIILGVGLGVWKVGALL
jgi:hypothetical protein